MSDKSAFVVSADWLEERLGETGPKIIDASWYLPAQNRDAKREFSDAHIPGAVFFDQDEIVEPGIALPHTLPSPAVFADHAARLGLSSADTIVVYDGLGMFTAPRVWWMLRTMGAEDVFVLDGGFDNWKKSGRPVTAEIAIPSMGDFEARYEEQAVTRLDQMLRIVDTQAMQIADSRGSGRFAGDEPEPREGMRSGHMPGARSVPVFSLSRDGELKSLDELRTIFEEAGIDPAKPVVTTCGSGVTAAVITLALESLGQANHTLYDGSWSEWGALKDTPIATGDA
jgi:thiosulfate/3-mercaptopyruvate sulfurtransferase